MPDSRIIYLTSTKGLTQQLMDDFESIGLVKIEGKGNYLCEGLPGHTCDTGSLSKCMYKGSSMCPWFAARSQASSQRLVTSNYACYMASYKYGNGFGHFDVMVCDEAHNVPDELARALSIQIGEREVHEDIKRDWPVSSDLDNMDAWKHWALVSRTMADQHLQRIKIEIDKNGSKPKPATVQQYQHYNSMVRRFADIATCRPEKWVVDTWMHGYQFDPIDPSEYAERTLFRGIEKVILVSGTLKHKVLDMLGIECDYAVYDYPYNGDAFRCPIMYIPTESVNYYSQPWQLRKIVARIDEIIESRMDRKGIIHTSNYKLRDFIMAHSKYGDRAGANKIMISNYSGTGDITSMVVDRFKSHKPPAVLVTPSVTTGYDFPYCLAPGTKVVTADLRWVPVESLVVGDEVGAFEEYPSLNYRSRLWTKARVTYTGVRTLGSYRLHFSDGTKIECSFNHKWLISVSHFQSWRQTNQLVVGNKVVKLLDVWKQRDDRDSGYLAAAFDGEGSFRITTLLFCQNDNAMLSEVMLLLDRNGYKYHIHSKGELSNRNMQCYDLGISTRASILRFMGEMRPVRLLPKLDWNGIGMIRGTTLTVTGIEKISDRELITIGTSTKTLIAEGLASHNSDCNYQIVAKLNYPFSASKIETARSRVDPERSSFQAIQSLEQAFGRGDRAEDDFQEFFILDDAFRTLKWKHEKLFSPVFLMNTRTLTKVPPAPEI